MAGATVSTAVLATMGLSQEGTTGAVVVALGGFVAAEIALVTVRPTRVEHLVELLLQRVDVDAACRQDPARLRLVGLIGEALRGEPELAVPNVDVVGFVPDAVAEVAAAARLLVSDAGAYINGQMIGVNGGGAT